MKKVYYDASLALLTERLLRYESTFVIEKGERDYGNFYRFSSSNRDPI